MMDITTTISILLVLISTCCGSPRSGEHKLLKSWLTGNLPADARPVLNGSKPIAVTIGLSIYRIIDFDRDNKIVDLIGWTNMKWVDEIRRWDPSEFGGVQAVSISTDKIWTPDVVLANALSKPAMLVEPRALVSHNGDVTWTPMYRWSVVCDDAVRNPAADPTCSLKFQSWSMRMKQLVLDNASERIVVSNYINNPEWELRKTKATPLGEVCPTCPDSFSQMVFSFTLTRRPNLAADKDISNDSVTLKASLVSVSLILVMVSFIRKL